MFRTSCARHKKKPFVNSVSYGIFSCIYVSSPAGWLTLRNCITMHGTKTQSSLICILNHVLLLEFVILCL
jgi:hypothetical protein